MQLYIEYHQTPNTTLTITRAVYQKNNNRYYEANSCVPLTTRIPFPAVSLHPCSACNSWASFPFAISPCGTSLPPDSAIMCPGPSIAVRFLCHLLRSIMATIAPRITKIASGTPAPIPAFVPVDKDLSGGAESVVEVLGKSEGSVWVPLHSYDPLIRPLCLYASKSLQLKDAFVVKIETLPPIARTLGMKML
jgi:hypothetical protein